MVRKALPALLLFVFPVFCFAQQQSATYSAILNGKQIRLKITNGFAGSDEIKAGSLTFFANSGHADATEHMMFQSKQIQTIEYFVLGNIQDSYATFPNVITGKYYRGRKAVSVRFKLDK